MAESVEVEVIVEVFEDAEEELGWERSKGNVLHLFARKMCHCSGSLSTRGIEVIFKTSAAFDNQ